MKNLCLFLGLLIPLIAPAQTINQPGKVRTISYNLKEKGSPIPDVRIKSLVEVRSKADGSFILPVQANKDNLFSFTEITKNGYELISPSPEELDLKQFAINPKEEKVIIMADIDTLFEQRRQIELHIRKAAEEEIAAKEMQLQEMENNIQKLRKENKDTKTLNKVLEQKIQELQKLKKTYYTSDEWIRKEAERLSKIDYQTIDSVQAKIVDLLKAGKGLEVIRITRSQFPDEIWGKIYNNPGAIKKDTEIKEQEIRENYRTMNHWGQQLKIWQMVMPPSIKTILLPII